VSARARRAAAAARDRARTHWVCLVLKPRLCIAETEQQPIIWAAVEAAAVLKSVVKHNHAPCLSLDREGTSCSTAMPFFLSCSGTRHLQLLAALPEGVQDVRAWYELGRSVCVGEIVQRHLRKR